ncbi:AAA family ATPase [Kosakonia cowanii]|uniref:AAA family ATPase n=1 Tax=Kosakonia cowanii TaxID=208223 RepID=UPI002DDCC8DC|nr:AAA family ATPase [Kosakonia cowanii]WRY61096.1 AAA family ATPase [Kosakonia cowanii]
MNINERKVMCTVDRSYYGDREEQFGKLRAYYEIFSNGEVLPINKGDFFCETEQVFVTGGFSEIKEKYKDSLFEVICTPTNFEKKEGDCKYVTRFSSCEEIKGLQVSQILNYKLPTPELPIIVTEEKPATKTILIEENDYLFGPFDYISTHDESTEQFTLNLKPINTPLGRIPQYHVGKLGIQKCVAHIATNPKNNITFLSNIKRNFEQVDEIIDYISDDQIIATYGNKVAQNSDIRSFTKGTIAQIRKHFVSSKEYKVFPQRFTRLFHCLENAEGWDETRVELLEGFISTEEGKGILKNYIEENRDIFFKEEKENITKRLNDETKKLNETIAELNTKKENLELEIRKKTRERNDIELNNSESLPSLTEEAKRKIEQQISTQKQQLDSLGKEIQSKEEKLSKLVNLDKLTTEIDDFEKERDRARDRMKKMEEQVEEVATKLKESNEVLTSRLVKLKPDVDALCGVRPKNESKARDYHVNVRKQSVDISIEDLREEIIDNVLDALNKQGRKTDYSTAANILTTIAQTQFTLFSGLPGTGKTSLAKMLGNCLGLQNRLLNIPVARGWSSFRDVLGFYNALSQSFTSSSTGLYEFLTHLHKEKSNNQESAAAIILLDEFNLSQPEHYFSPFLEMSDPESQRILSTGNPDEPYLTVPDYLRFLGTINQDETVQTLTPRLLDRAAIINFDDFEQNYDLNIKETEAKKNIAIEAISGNDFIKAFQPTSLEVPQDVEQTLQSIVSILRDDSIDLGLPVIVSYRKIKAIRYYYNIAGPLMSMESRYLALDYAISQHILPLLNGYGQGFGKRLEALLNIIPDEMERSSKILKRIVSHGNQNLFGYGNNI